MTAGPTIYPDAMDPIADGLRSAVDAYAWIRQGVDLRMPAQEPIIEPIEYDEEDEELLRCSMEDMKREFREDAAEL